MFHPSDISATAIVCICSKQCVYGVTNLASYHGNIVLLHLPGCILYAEVMLSESRGVHLAVNCARAA